MRIRLPNLLRLLPPRRGTVFQDRSVPGTDVAKSSESHAGDVTAMPPGPFVLLLRTFRKDGDTRVGDPREGDGYTMDTLESIVGRVASEFDTDVHALHDEEASFIPQGVNYFKTENEEWYRHFLALMRGARAIVVFSPGTLDLGDSYRDELAALRSEGVSDRVVVVSPPTLDKQHHGTKREVFEELGWPSPPAMPLVAWRLPTGQVTFYPSLGSDDDSLAHRYESGFRVALTQIVGASTAGRTRRPRLPRS